MREAIIILAINDSETEGMSKKHRSCLTFGNRQFSEPIIDYPIPNQSWTKIALNVYYYLLMIDYYSKLIVIQMLKNLQSSTVIKKCKKIFSQFETSVESIVDNLSELTSHYFKLFLRSQYFEYQIISSHFVSIKWNSTTYYTNC